MRKAYHNLAVYRNDIGELIGVGLGSDFCAEHEWGIKKLKNRFKIDDTKDGIEKRAITTSNVFAGDFIRKRNKPFKKFYGFDARKLRLRIYECRCNKLSPRIQLL